LDQSCKSYRSLDNVSKDESKAQLKDEVDRPTAIEDLDITKEFKGVPTDAQTPTVTKRRESWRQAGE
jgi:hypothetical protein